MADQRKRSGDDIAGWADKEPIRGIAPEEDEFEDSEDSEDSDDEEDETEDESTF
jgi:hypothetical protein